MTSVSGPNTIITSETRDIRVRLKNCYHERDSQKYPKVVKGWESVTGNRGVNSEVRRRSVSSVSSVTASEEAGAREAETKVGPVLLLAEFQPSATSRSGQERIWPATSEAEQSGKERSEGDIVGLICLSALLDTPFSPFFISASTRSEMDQPIVSRFEIYPRISPDGIFRSANEV